MLGDEVRARRLRRSITQEELAAASGVGVRTIRAIEAGSVARPRPGTVRLLAEALKLDDEEQDDLYQSVLREFGDQQPSAASRTHQGAGSSGLPGRSTPTQLPGETDRFVGRIEQLRQLTAMLDTNDQSPARQLVVTITGTAGVGKTALAVHWAHQVRGRFPDGQLYVNLRGFDPASSPVSSADVVRDFLDALDVPPQRMPTSLGAQVDLYHSLLADRRMLIVLDNARDAEQVRPLLPGTTGCLALVTSRNQLSNLVTAEGARPLTLDVLTPDEARQLLENRLGADRIAAEPEAIDEIITRCAWLPLALAIAATRAAIDPSLPLRRLAEDLHDGGRGLEVVSDRATASPSHTALTEQGDLPAPPTEVDGTMPSPPGLLPRALPDFVGRETETKLLIDQLTGTDVPARVVVISGLSGMGKTSLAVQLAHQLRLRSPAGQLFVDLRGNDGPLAPTEALGQLLRALGVDGTAIPDSPDERAACLRATLVRRRCMLLLDNAASATQVRPLLPGNDVMVLVTSRNALVDLDGAHHLRLDPLSQDEAVELLTRIVGPERVTGEPKEAEQIARYCGGIPLAVRIASANLVAQPHRTLRAVAAELADPAGRLDQLERPDRSMRKVLDSAYRHLSEAAKQLLRGLSLVAHRNSPLWLADVISGDRQTGHAALQALSEASLVEFAGPDPAGQQRCHLHELVGAFGRERAQAEEAPDDQVRALQSVLGSWLTLAEEADALLSGYVDAPYIRIGRSVARSPAPTDVHRANPHAWFTAERETLIALIGQAAGAPAPLDAFAWTLAWNCEYFLRLEAQYDAVARVCQQGLAAADRSDDWEGIAAMRLCIASAHLLRDEPAIALDHIRRAQAAGERTSNDWLTGEIWSVTEQVLRMAPDQPGVHGREVALRRAIEHFEAVGDARSAGTRLTALGALAADRDDPTAGSTLTRGVHALRAAGTRRGLAMGLRRLASWHSMTGDFKAARELYLECLTLAQAAQDVAGEICVRSELASALAGAGELAEAAGHVAEALAKTNGLDVPLYTAYARYANGRLKLKRGELGPARSEIEAALDSLHTRPAWQIAALMDLAEAHQRAGDQAAAAAVLQRALEVSTQHGVTAQARLVRQRLTDLGTDEPVEPASSDSRTRLSGPLHVIEIADPDHG